MIPRIHTKALTAASANNICASQTPGAAGNLTINGSAASGGVATLDTQRRVLITCTGNETGKTFVVYGTNDGGNAIQESLAGPNATTVASSRDYKTVTRISISAAAANALTVGTNTTGSTPWVTADTWRTPFQIEVDNSISGTVTYSIETTNSDIQSATVVPTPRATSVAGATAAATLALTSPSRAWRTTVTAGTGTVTTEAVQAG